MTSHIYCKQCSAFCNDCLYKSRYNGAQKVRIKEQSLFVFLPKKQLKAPL